MDDVFRLLLAQIRSKRETAGDLRAQIAANTTGVRRIQALVERHGRDTVLATIDELLAYTERRTRGGARGAAARRRTRPRARSTPTATPTSRCSSARASTIAEDGVHFDLTGCDPQRRAPVNSTYAQTFSACAYVVKCLIDPDMPVNDGFYRLITVDAPAGTVVNCTGRRPSSAAGRRRRA